MVGSRELRVEWREKASEMEAGGTSISAGTGAPVPWTDGAVLANVQPTPSSTTRLTHAETGEPFASLHHADHCRVSQQPGLKHGVSIALVAPVKHWQTLRCHHFPPSSETESRSPVRGQLVAYSCPSTMSTRFLLPWNLPTATPGKDSITEWMRGRKWWLLWRVLQDILSGNNMKNSG
ncbi:unnamed protein product [Arctogadus glacialis]